MEFLIESGADIDAADEFGLTPLNVAVNEGRLYAMKYLIERGATANARWCLSILEHNITDFQLMMLTYKSNFSDPFYQNVEDGGVIEDEYFLNVLLENDLL